MRTASNEIFHQRAGKSGDENEFSVTTQLLIPRRSLCPCRDADFINFKHFSLLAHAGRTLTAIDSGAGKFSAAHASSVRYWARLPAMTLKR